MPSINRDDFKHNAKIFEFNCAFCGHKAYANKPAGKYCSDLCRVNAYKKRKEDSNNNSSSNIQTFESDEDDDLFNGDAALMKIANKYL